MSCFTRKEKDEMRAMLEDTLERLGVSIAEWNRIMSLFEDDEYDEVIARVEKIRESRGNKN